MTKKLVTILILLFVASGLLIANELKTIRPPKLLRDGLALDGLEGTLTKSDTGKWSFKFDSTVTDFQISLAPESSLEILRSSALEKIVGYIDQGGKKTCRIWGTVTKYNDRNFIFPIYFLPIGEKLLPKPEVKPEEKPEQPKQTKSKPKAPSINDPNDELQMPEHIIAKLKKRKVIRAEQLIPRPDTKPIEFKQDVILADRTGFLTYDENSQPIFQIDGVGRNVEALTLELLPCQILQIAEQKQDTQLEKQRLKAAGIITKYDGKFFLLLHRARKVYSHGNFN